MAGEAVIEFTDDNFETEVLHADKPVLVDFWAPWCGPCKIIAPTIDALAKENAAGFRIGKLNVDDSPGVAARYGISGIPTLMVFSKGQVVQKFVGVTSKDELQKALNAVG